MAGLTDDGLEAAFRTVLAPLARDAAQDGDCLRYAPAITDAAVRQGFSARTMIVAGWMDSDETILGFLHHVTVCDQ
ncbi:hypothetical protein [Nocardia terpenica]|nr:hypothetical protein [Nocardia terpenica]NQE89769.1 hypothetical protein [Nocardia terpenica]